MCIVLHNKDDFWQNVTFNFVTCMYEFSSVAAKVNVKSHSLIFLMLH